MGMLKTPHRLGLPAAQYESPRRWAATKAKQAKQTKLDEAMARRGYLPWPTAVLPGNRRTRDAVFRMRPSVDRVYAPDWLVDLWKMKLIGSDVGPNFWKAVHAALYDETERKALLMETELECEALSDVFMQRRGDLWAGMRDFR